MGLCHPIPGQPVRCPRPTYVAAAVVLAYRGRASITPVEHRKGSAVVKTRHAGVRSASVLSASVLLMSVGTGESLAQDGPIDFADAPFVIFAPAPPLPDEIADYPLPDGAEDYWQLFADDAPWARAAEHVDAFAIHGWMLRYAATDDDLRRMLAWLEARDIPLGMEVEPLTWPGPDVCDHTESFEGPYELDEARRIRALGGQVDFIALDEPYAHAHRLTGPGACGYPVEQVVDEVADFVAAFRRIHPGVQVGSIEPMWTDPPIGAHDMATWVDTWEERTGEPFAFLNVDVDWRREEWPTVVSDVEAVADARGVPLGILYLGSGFERSNDAWLEQMAQHAATLEQGEGVSPQVVGFYSWHSQPDRLLPDDDLGAYTGRINQYFSTRTALEEPVAQQGAASGRLTTLDGTPLAGRSLLVTAEPIDGARLRHKLSGTVPPGARRALVAVRANIEGGTPSRVDVRISDVSYREHGKGRNRVPNGRLAEGLEGWGPYGSGSVAVVRGQGGPAMRIRAKPKQTILVDGQSFKVTAGADFEFAATIDVPGTSIGSGYVSVIFLGDEEVARESLWFNTRPIALPPVTTDAGGRYRVPTAKLRPGRYDLLVTYDGDIDHWAANTRSRIRVR